MWTGGQAGELSGSGEFVRKHGSSESTHRLASLLTGSVDSGQAAEKATGVPSEICFQTKPEIALEQIRSAVQREIPIAPLLADAGYGNDTAFRDGISDLGLFYVVGIQSAVSVWPPGEAPLPKRKWKGIGRPTKLLRRNGQHAPMAVRELAISLPCAAWKMVRWREGSGKPLRSRFAALRIRPAHRDYWNSEPRPQEWLLIEWPKQESEPTKYWLSTLPAHTSLPALVRLAKHRWIIERDYQELKQELGIGHYGCERVQKNTRRAGWKEERAS